MSNADITKAAEEKLKEYANRLWLGQLTESHFAMYYKARNPDIATNTAEEKLKNYANKLSLLKQKKEWNFSEAQKKHYQSIRTINPDATKAGLKEEKKLDKEIEKTKKVHGELEKEVEKTKQAYEQKAKAAAQEAYKKYTKQVKKTKNAYYKLFCKTYGVNQIEARYAYKNAEKEAQGNPEVFAKSYKAELDWKKFSYYLSQLYLKASKDPTSTGMALYQELCKEYASYLANSTPENLKIFQINCKAALMKAREPMEKLGFKDILTNLLKAIASFGTLLIYNKHTYDKFFVSDNFVHFTKVEKSFRAMAPEASEENEENNNANKPKA